MFIINPAPYHFILLLSPEQAEESNVLLLFPLLPRQVCKLYKTLLNTQTAGDPVLVFVYPSQLMLPLRGADDTASAGKAVSDRKSHFLTVQSTFRTSNHVI